MGTKRDFIVESNGLCFICLKRSEISPQRKRESNSRGPPNLPIHSLQSLSRFLKMDMDEVFRNQDDIPSHLLTMVKQSILKTELCEKCSSLIEKFSLLNQQLEKIRMEVMSSLGAIHDNLVEAGEGDKNELDKMAPSRIHSMTNHKDRRLDKPDIFKILRCEIIEKISGLILSSGPRIKVENLSMKGISIKKLKLKQEQMLDAKVPHSILDKHCDETGEPEIHIGNIKSEYPMESLTFQDGDDDNDDHTSSYPHEEELNNAEMKVDVHQLRLSRTPCDDNVMTGADAAVPQPRRSSKLTGTIVPFNPSKANGNYHCNLCDKQYKTRHVLRNHYNRVHQKIRYICNTCDKEFAKRQAYKGHYQAVHFGGVGQTCKKCNRTFTAKANLERHQRMGSCIAKSCRKRHFCELCDSSYNRVDNLKWHVKAVHSKSS